MSREQFIQIYPTLKRSIVAIASKVSSNPEFPDIIGTGFVAREDGIIFTNNHVVQAIFGLPRLKAQTTQWPAYVIVFHLIPGKGMAIVKLEIEGVGTPSPPPKQPTVHYGPEVPDVGFITVKARGLPTLKICEKFSVPEGGLVMLSGFPMGTDTLRAPGRIHQLNPTLQAATVSAILPFPNEFPHAVLLDVMIRGGSSGSPVFVTETGEVAAVAYASLTDTRTLKGQSGVLILSESTSLTLAVPAAFLMQLLAQLDAIEIVAKRNVDQLPTFDQLIATGDYKIRLPGEPDPGMAPVNPEDLLSRQQTPKNSV